MDIKYHSPFNELVFNNGKDIFALQESDIDQLLMVLAEARRDLYTELIGDTLGMSHYCVGVTEILPEAVQKVGLVTTLKYLKCLDVWHRQDDDYRRRLRGDIIYLEMVLAGQITLETVDNKPKAETEEQLEEAILQYIDKSEKKVVTVNRDGTEVKVIDFVYAREPDILEAFEGFAAEVVFALLDKLVAEKRIVEGMGGMGGMM